MKIWQHYDRCVPLFQHKTVKNVVKNSLAHLMLPSQSQTFNYLTLNQINHEQKTFCKTTR
jgi:hypothetical protein